MEKVQLHIGDIVNGIVNSVNKNYSLISLGELNAILPSSEYSWSKDLNLKKVLNVGDELSTVVIIISGQEVVVSTKRLTPNPWKNVDARYTVGQIVKGKIISVIEYGAFIEIEDGITGLLHKSEIPDEKKCNISSLFELEQELEVKIISIESDKKRISFSLKLLV